MESTLIFLFLLLLVAWFWRDGMRAREVAAGMCRDACHRHHVQFLDDTVALSALRLMRCQTGGLCIRRTYRFEFSDDGNNRVQGLISLAGADVEAIHLPTRERELT